MDGKAMLADLSRESAEPSVELLLLTRSGRQRVGDRREAAQGIGA